MKVGMEAGAGTEASAGMAPAGGPAGAGVTLGVGTPAGAGARVGVGIPAGAGAPAWAWHLVQQRKLSPGGSPGAEPVLCQAPLALARTSSVDRVRRRRQCTHPQRTAASTGLF